MAENLLEDKLISNCSDPIINELVKLLYVVYDNMMQLNIDIPLKDPNHDINYSIDLIDHSRILYCFLNFIKYTVNEIVCINKQLSGDIEIQKARKSESGDCWILPNLDEIINNLSDPSQNIIFIGTFSSRLFNGALKNIFKDLYDTKYILNFDKEKKLNMCVNFMEIVDNLYYLENSISKNKNEDTKIKLFIINKFYENLKYNKYGICGFQPINIKFIKIFDYNLYDSFI